MPFEEPWCGTGNRYVFSHCGLSLMLENLSYRGVTDFIILKIVDKADLKQSDVSSKLLRTRCQSRC